MAILFGVITVYCAAVLGSTCAMLLGRFVFREVLYNKYKKYRLFLAIDKAVATEVIIYLKLILKGIKLVFLLRLCPIAPFTLLNYLFGITSIKVTHFMIGGFGMVPGAIVYVMLGTTISSIADAADGNFEGGVLTLIMMIFGTIMALVAIIYISIVTKRYLNNNLIDLDREGDYVEQTDEVDSNGESPDPLNSANR